MNEAHVCDIKEIFIQLNNSLYFKLCQIIEIEELSLGETYDREKMIKSLKKYITALDYAEKTY